MNTKKIEIKERHYKICEIVNGPNKDTLFDACKYAYSKTTIAIDFGVAAGYTMPRDHPGCAYVPMDMSDVVIRGIEHEDKSGEHFIIHGICKTTLPRSSDSAKFYKFNAYYDSKTRTGTITFFE